MTGKDCELIAAGLKGGDIKLLGHGERLESKREKAADQAGHDKSPLTGPIGRELD
jgi:hypothetical protein